MLRILARGGFKEEYFLITLALLIGAATGLGAHLFFELIEYATHLAYGASDGLFAGRPYMIVVMPVVAALAVGAMTYRFAREAKGHGVPEVMDAIYRQGGVIRARVAIVKAVASALTIGSGGSAGTEGPIVQIGAAVGSGFGQFLNVERRQMGILVACGVAGGIAAIFNAPIAGVLFALEIFLKDFSLRAFAPVVFASVISCSITHALRFGGGDVAIFQVYQDAQYNFSGLELPYFLLLGVLCAIVAAVFIKSLYAAEDLADRLTIPDYLKPAIGAFGLGILGLIFLLTTEPGSHQMPSFFGNGYTLIETAISPKVFNEGVGLLLLLLVLKILATCLTLGSGGSGGIFAPSLFMGAVTGGAFGLILYQVGLIPQDSITAYALVGMAAVLAGTTHAPLTAIVMLYEITREPKVILPIMFAAIVATTVAQNLCRDSIYTLKLRRRGVRVGTLADLTILKGISAHQVATSPAVLVHPEDPLQKLIDLATENETGDFVVVDPDGAFQGLVIAEDIRTALLQPEAVPLLLVGELLRQGIPIIDPDETLDNVMDAFAKSNVQSLPVGMDNNSDHVKCLITRQAVMTRYHQEFEVHSD